MKTNNFKGPKIYWKSCPIPPAKLCFGRKILIVKSTYDFDMVEVIRPLGSCAKSYENFWIADVEGHLWDPNALVNVKWDYWDNAPCQSSKILQLKSKRYRRPSMYRNYIS